MKCKKEKDAVLNQILETISEYEVYDDEPDNARRIISEMKHLIRELLSTQPSQE